MNETSKIELYQERDMGQIIAVAATIFRRHWKHMFRTIGLMSLPLFLMTSTLYFLTGNSITSGELPNMNSFKDLSLNMLLSGLSGYLAFTVLTWSCIYYIQLYEEKGPENFDATDIWNKVFNHGWQLLLVNIIYFVLFMLAAVVLFLTFFTFILIPVSLVAFLFLYTFFFFLPVVFLMEKRGIFPSIERALSLLKKRWLKAIGILICTVTVIMGFIFTPIFFGSLLSETLGGFGFEAQDLVQNAWIVILIQNVSLIFSFVATFFLMTGFASLYYSLVESRDLHTLTQRVEQLSEETETGTYS